MPVGEFSSTFTVEQSARRLAVSANSHVRLSDKHRTALAAALRAGIARLRFEDGEILRGAFRGPKPTDRTDVENLVFYNLELESAVVRRGVAFEHSSQPPATETVGYVYEPVPCRNATRLWRTGNRIISWTNVVLPGRIAPAVWWAMQPHGHPEGIAADGEDLFIVCRVSTAATIGVTQLKALVAWMLRGARLHRSLRRRGPLHLRGMRGRLGSRCRSGVAASARRPVRDGLAGRRGVTY